MKSPVMPIMGTPVVDDSGVAKTEWYLFFDSLRRWSTSDDVVSVLDFGAAGDGATDDTVAINKAIAYAAGLGKGLFFPANTYLVSTLATLTVYNTALLGEPGARIKFTGAGTGAGITIDGTTARDGLNIIIRDLILDGQGTLDYGIDALLCVKARLQNIRVTNVKTAGVRLRFCVTNIVDSLTVSTNVEAFTTIPVSGIILTHDATVNPCADNIIYNPAIEGVSGAGIDIVRAQGTVIINGTSEGNGTGLRIGSDSLLTTVFNTDFEVNSSFDLDISGSHNDFHNLVSVSTAAIKLRSGAIQNHFYNGYLHPAVLDSGAKYNGFHNCTWVTSGTQYTDNDGGNVLDNCLNLFSGQRIRNLQQAAQTFTGVVGLQGGIDSDLISTAPYPGTGLTPPPLQLIAKAIQSGGATVADCGVKLIFTRLSDTDYASRVELWTSHDNITALAGWFSPEGRFISGSSSDDLTNQVQITGDLKASGNLGLGVTALEKLDILDGNQYIRSSYPGTGATPTARKLFFETINNGAFRVAGCGILGRYTRISDSDFASALEFWTSHNNTPALAGWFSPEGRFIVGSASDDLTNQVQVTGDLKVTGTITGGGFSGSGTVTHTAGALTSGQLIVGNGSADIKTGNLTGDITTSGGTVTTLRDLTGSYAAIVSSLDLTGQTASVGATNLRKGGSVLVAGMYRLSVYLSMSPTGAATLTATMTYTDRRGIAETKTLGISGSAGVDGGSNFPLRLDGTHDLTVAVALTGTATFDVTAVVERLL